MIIFFVKFDIIVNEITEFTKISLQYYFWLKLSEAPTLYNNQNSDGWYDFNDFESVLIFKYSKNNKEKEK